MRGFLVGEFGDKAQEFAPRMAGWLSRRIGQHSTRPSVDGLENAPQAFIGLLRGANTGKMVVKFVTPTAH